jgi:hypothetical protein
LARYDVVDSGSREVSLDVLLALQSGPRIRISVAILTEFHKNLVHALDLLQSPHKLAAARMQKYLKKGTPKDLAQLRFTDRSDRNISDALGNHPDPAKLKADIVNYIMGRENSEDSAVIVQFLDQFWNERNVLEWQTLSCGIANGHLFALTFCKAVFDECVTLESTIDRIRRSRGSFASENGGRGCGSSCTSRHDGAICLVCGVGYNSHADHTCPHAIQQLRVDNMHERRGKTPVHVRRDDLLGSSLQAISNIPDAALSKELAISFDGEEGIDAGGLLKSWLSGVNEQLAAPGALLLPVIYKGATTCLRLNPIPAALGLDDKSAAQRLRLLGVLIGVSLVRTHFDRLQPYFSSIPTIANPLPFTLQLEPPSSQRPPLPIRSNVFP